MSLNQYIYPLGARCNVYIYRLAPCTNGMYLIYNIVAYSMKSINFEPELDADKWWTIHTTVCKKQYFPNRTPLTS